MTNWRERRLGVRARPWRKREQPEATAPAPGPVIITIALRQSAQDHAQEALDALVALVRQASSEHVRVAAANAILDRALGKPLPGAKVVADEADAEEGGPL